MGKLVWMSDYRKPRPGQYIGEALDGKPGGHFIQCPGCQEWFDCRDLSQVFAHYGPLPHLVED